VGGGESHLLGRDLGLLHTAHLLGPVLALLALLAADGSLGAEAHSDETVLGLELLGDVGSVIDEAKARALASTEGGLKAEDGDGLLVGLVQLGELLADLNL